MNFQIQVPRSRFQEKTQGFLGNLDNNRGNDIFRRGETALISDHNLSDRQLFSILNTCKAVYILSYTCTKLLYN